MIALLLAVGEIFVLYNFYNCEVPCREENTIAEVYLNGNKMILLVFVLGFVAHVNLIMQSQEKVCNSLCLSHFARSLTSFTSSTCIDSR